MTPAYDIVGVGVGPFNLSLAALLSQVDGVRARFFEKRPSFAWHSELMFRDSVMQTSCLKDLVTPVSPTNPHSYLNFLVAHGLFYAHMNTGRTRVSRREFEKYCQWVAENLGERLTFGASVDRVEYKDGLFHVEAGEHKTTARHLCVGTGMVPWVPEFARQHLGANCLHPKSPEFARLDLEGKRVVVVGGGQTGLEVFRNAFNGRWGEARAVTLVTSRHTLEPLDESPFTNEYFSPGYVADFFGIGDEAKAATVRHQRLASDGNTPDYLQSLYNELYQLRHVEGRGENVRILPQRRAVGLEPVGTGFRVAVNNAFTGKSETMGADVVIFCTGFRNAIPACLSQLESDLQRDAEGRLMPNAHFALDWSHGASNKVYALNFGRHSHGIAEPQTSLMAWRSATVINDLLDKEIFPGLGAAGNFAQHGTYDEN